MITPKKASELNKIIEVLSEENGTLLDEQPT